MILIAIACFILFFLTGVRIASKERDQSQILPPLASFDPKGEETYLVEGNALKWVGGNYVKTEVRGVITGYSSDPAETDESPYETASGTIVNPKTIACPRDIPFGTIVMIDSQEYICEDRMALKHDGKFDLWFFTKEEAINFGKQTKTIIIYEPN